MPRPRNNLVESYFNIIDSRQCSCSVIECKKILVRQSSNLERHLRIVHPTYHEDYISQKEKIVPKSLQKAQKSIKCEDFSSFNDDSLNRTQSTTNNDKEQSRVRTNNTQNCTPEVPAHTIIQNHTHDPMLIQKAGELWTIKLQSMDPTQALLAEKLINDVIYNGQLGQLNPNSSVQLGLQLLE